MAITSIVPRKPVSALKFVARSLKTGLQQQQSRKAKQILKESNGGSSRLVVDNDDNKAWQIFNNDKLVVLKLLNLREV